jgi:hypothetical protein
MNLEVFFLEWQQATCTNEDSFRRSFSTMASPSPTSSYNKLHALHTH